MIQWARAPVRGLLKRRVETMRIKGSLRSGPAPPACAADLLLLHALRVINTQIIPRQPDHCGSSVRKLIYASSWSPLLSAYRRWCVCDSFCLKMKGDHSPYDNGLFEQNAVMRLNYFIECMMNSSREIHKNHSGGLRERISIFLSKSHTKRYYLMSCTIWL